LYRDFAIAFWKTSRDDLGRAEDAMQERAFSYVVFHSQQCVEKVVKALLEMKQIFQGKWNASRYPFIKDGKVVTPSEDFTEIEASIALLRARKSINFRFSIFQLSTNLKNILMNLKK